VFETEPATENPLFGLPNVVCTPHLGASTSEAQENVALQVAEQMSDYLIAARFPTPSTCRRFRRKKRRGSSPSSSSPTCSARFAGQVTESPIKEVEILYDGMTAGMNTKALTSALLAGLIRPQVADVNMVSAPVMVKERASCFPRSSATRPASMTATSS
jgi:D-3-phosphoglycerate dehydrogenase